MKQKTYKGDVCTPKKLHEAFSDLNYTPHIVEYETTFQRKKYCLINGHYEGKRLKDGIIHLQSNIHEHKGWYFGTEISIKFFHVSKKQESELEDTIKNIVEKNMKKKRC